MSVESKNHMPRISSRLEKTLSNLVRKTLFSIEARTKANAPVDKGILRNSYQVQMEGPTKGSVGTNIEYGPYQEFGTRFQKGTPHLTPAADTEKAKFEKELRNIERSLR